MRLDPARAELDPKGEALIRKSARRLAANLLLATEALEADWERPSGRRTASWSDSRQMAATHGLKLGDALQPIRVALTGSTVSEPVNELLAVVGSERSIGRMREVAARWGTDESAA